MHQFFVEKSQVGKEYVTITGSDVNHIRNVLRMKIGETIRISDREGGNYFCKIAETGENFVQADIVSVDEEGTELPSKIYLFQALPKGDRMETVIEKAVELGVYEIIPVAMKYCVVKLEGKKADKVIIEVSSMEDMERYKEFLSDDLYIQLSENKIGMIMKKNATKSNGIIFLAQSYGINIDDVICFGDDYNDIDMLTLCGTGICMANGVQKAKDAADVLCDTNENDGVAKWIKENILSNQQ